MYRTVDCDTWDDPWFAELDPECKLLFLYLVTNRRTSACGAFEITTKAIAFETGIPRERIEADLGDLAPKVVWWPDLQVVWLRNFYKHQRANSNDKFALGAAKALLELPEQVQVALCDAYDELLVAIGNLRGGFDTHPHATPMPPPSDGGKETVTVKEQLSKETVVKTAQAPKKKKTGAPTSFEIDESMEVWAIEAGFRGDRQHLEAVTANFLDHHTAKGTLSLDWRRSWQTWIRNSISYGQDLPSKGGQPARGTNGAKGNMSDPEVIAKYLPGGKYGHLTVVSDKT